MTLRETHLVLVADDEEDIRALVAFRLRRAGYDVITAADGAEALTLATTRLPDLIVLDMMMPKKSGFLVLEKLRSRPGGMIPTIMITGNEGSRHRAYAEMLGVREYIRKPFAMEKLVRAVDDVLAGRPAGGPTGEDG